MASPLLTLGPFAFVGFESPQRIHLTAKQRLNVHHLGTGSTAVDSLGTDFQIASFQGIFSGVGAMMRIRSLEYLRYQGAPLPLTWGSRSLTVIIQKLDLNYLSNQWVPYNLSCLVLQTGASTAHTSIAQSYSPDAQVADICNMLLERSIAVSQGQTTALVTLAARDYDKAPTDAMAQAAELLNAIDDVLAISSPVDGSSEQDSGVPAARQIIDVVTSAGQQAILTSARNLVANIYVIADCVNQ